MTITKNRTLTVATRGGKLALAQTRIVISGLRRRYRHLEFHIKQITTAGDRDRKTALWTLESAGFFSSAVQDAVIAGKADLAIHSFKDLPVEYPPELTVSAVCARDYPEDCLIMAGTYNNNNSLAGLPQKAKIGTSSLRRVVQLKKLRPDLMPLPIRGNVTTRLEKLEQGKFDAIILARAGLERLKLAEKISVTFDPFEFIPAPAQGAIAVQTRKNDKSTTELVNSIDNKDYRITCRSERNILSVTQAGCHAPIGAFAAIDKSDIVITAFVASPNGETFIKEQIKGPLENSLRISKTLAGQLLEEGGDRILKSLEK